LEDKRAIATIETHLDQISQRIDAVRKRLIEERDRRGPESKRGHESIGDTSRQTHAEERSTPQTAVIQLSGMFELLLSEDSLNLAAIAMVHAKVREVMSEAAAPTRTPTSATQVTPQDKRERNLAAFATSLATFVCQGSSNTSAAEFSMAVVDRACELYAQLIDESTESSSTSHG
jgi:hypothetical protein